MTRALADTSIFIARESGRPIDKSMIPAELAISVVTYGELRAGLLAAHDLATREIRLATLMQAATLQPVPIDERVADAWAALRIRLRDAGRTMKVNDAWIAATALALGVPVLTQDDDYRGVPSLEVIRV